MVILRSRIDHKVALITKFELKSILQISGFGVAFAIGAIGYRTLSPMIRRYARLVFGFVYGFFFLDRDFDLDFVDSGMTNRNWRHWMGTA